MKSAHTDDEPSPDHQRPADADDTAVEAAGLMSEALETIEQARGHLYAFHQLTGRADGMLDDVVAKLTDAGHPELADLVDHELIGRNVLPGRWTFQVVEDYDDGYYDCFRGIERQIRDRLMRGRRHVYVAEMTERRRTHGHPAHTARPPEQERLLTGDSGRR